MNRRPPNDLTVDNTTFATNRGELNASLLRWLFHKPLWLLVWISAAALCTAAALFLHWAFWVSAILFTLLLVLYCVRIREHFWSGDANPGLIVSTDPLLMAVATDLSRQIDGAWLAVKISPVRLFGIEGREPRVGDRLATVALYRRSPEPLPHWIDFDPFPAQYATGDVRAIEWVMKSFSPDDWARLERLLARVPRPIAAGLYMIGRDRFGDDLRGPTRRA